ncbi:hypothetical protein HZ326_10442 [Fusarium oxysporum f. sp. albedinis]|nr:hypothetical protein HZ326_10442 [Fusarium oxysporum f. sp. albedinis]
MGNQHLSETGATGIQCAQLRAPATSTMHPISIQRRGETSNVHMYKGFTSKPYQHRPPAGKSTVTVLQQISLQPESIM